MTVREFLQKLGTEAVREGLHKNAWVNALFADFKPHEHNWVVTDTRFPNEAQAIRAMGGKIIRVNRDQAVTGDFSINFRGWKVKENAHPSETALDDYAFDWVITNNGSVESLVEKVKGMLLFFHFIEKR